MAEVLEPGVVIKPQMDKDQAISWIWHLYGLKATNVKELNSYDDRNFFFKIDPDESKIDNEFLSKEDFEHGLNLKVTNSLDSKDLPFNEAQIGMMLHLHQSGMEVPVPIKNKNGDFWSLEELQSEKRNDWKENNEEKTNSSSKHIVRILKFVPGQTFYDIKPWTCEQFYDAGVFVAQVDQVLKSFKHPAYDSRNMLWYLTSIPEVKNFTSAVSNPRNRAMVEAIFDEFAGKVLSKIDQFEAQIIHGDFNEQNILVRQAEKGGKFEIFSVIDYGDSQKNALVFELGINIMYMMTNSSIDPNLVGGHVLAGYQTVRKLPEMEMEALKLCVAARYAQSLVMGAYSHQQDPTNDYLLTTAQNGWKILSEFWSVPQAELYAKWNEIVKSYQK